MLPLACGDTCLCPLRLVLCLTYVPPSNSRFDGGASVGSLATFEPSRDVVRVLIIGAPTTDFPGIGGRLSWLRSRCLPLPLVLVKSPSSGKHRPSRSESEDSISRE